MPPEITTEFVDANGLRFEVNMCGEGKKLAICLHGFPEHAYSWRHQMPLLADMGYKVWAPNLRGYGMSSRPELMDDYSIENLMEDVACLIDAAQCDSVVMIAHDWGAVIAWYFAMHKIRNIDHLIIMNVPHPVPMRAAMVGGLEQLKKSWYILFFQIPRLPEWLLGLNGAAAIGDMFKNTVSDPGRFPIEARELYRKNAAHPGALKAMINWYRGLIRGGGGKRMDVKGYPVIDIPTLMIWGEDDVALSKKSTYGTDKVCSDFTIRYLPKVSHWVQQEAPEAVNAIVKAWLNGDTVPQFEWELKQVRELTDENA